MSEINTDAITAQREAFVAGAKRLHLATHGRLDLEPPMLALMEKAARARFPMPSVDIPRVAHDPTLEDYEWKASTSMIYVRYKGGAWKVPDEAVAITPARVSLWAYLFATPTITVYSDDPRVSVDTVEEAYRP